MGTATVPDLGRLNEAEYTTWVLDVCDAFGWRLRYHTYRSKRSQPGFPDWTLIHERVGAVVFVELKGWNTPVKPEQVRFVNGLRAAGCAAYIWRPRHAAEAFDVLAHPERVRSPMDTVLPPVTPEDYAR